MVIVRQPVREEVRRLLLDRLLTGDLDPGQRVNEKAIADELGVSRTPVREAMLCLEQEGFLRAEMAKGFIVLPLTTEEVGELYPIVVALETLALRTGDPTAVVPDLRKLLSKMKNASNPEDVRQLDEAWHKKLISCSENRRLLDMIDSIKQLTQRYEVAYMRENELVASSIAHHEEILGALESGHVDNAAKLLEEHWDFGTKSILDWLARQSK